MHFLYYMTNIFVRKGRKGRVQDELSYILAAAFKQNVLKNISS